jgi:hypothetical protein
MVVGDLIDFRSKFLDEIYRELLVRCHCSVVDAQGSRDEMLAPHPNVNDVMIRSERWTRFNE